MGWASGGDLVHAIIRSAKKNVPDEKARTKLYRDVVNAFEGHDWDTQPEALGFDPVFDKLMKKRGFTLEEDE